MQNLIFPLLIVVLAVPLFLSARKQKKKAAEQQQLQKSIGPGDRVMTTSGLFGTVASSDDDTIDIEIAPGLVTTWLRAAVREKVNPTADDSDGEDSDDDVDVSDVDLDEEASELVDEEKAADAKSGGKTVTSGADIAPPLENSKKIS